MKQTSETARFWDLYVPEQDLELAFFPSILSFTSVHMHGNFLDELAH